MPDQRKGIEVTTRGLAALIVGAVVVTTAMIGGAWALAVSLQARSEIQTTAAYAPPSGRLSWPGRDAGGMAGEWSAEQRTASAFDLDGTFSLVTPEPKFDLAGTFELLAAKSDNAKREAPRPAEPDTLGFTWSSYRLAALDDVSTSLSLLRPKSEDARKPRLRLASLTPLDGVDTQQSDEDSYAGRTAIYDITARVLHMPNGEQLEAHSGLGGLMDDPDYVHQRMNGATPPNIYNLKLRESLFHGVQAVRMLPTKEKEMFGRSGILVHPFMLGATGQSNGCISVRDYAKFLQAFQRGEVARIIVVPRLPRTPSLWARLTNTL